MEITDVSVTKLRADLETPNAISKGRSSDSRPAAIVEVETDEGITGIGEGYGPNPHIVETIVERKFAEKLVGENPLDVERLWEEMVRGYTYWDQKGQGVSAASGVDMALWDVVGKHYDAPVHRLLGGDARGTGRVRAYASDLFWDDPGAMAEKAAGYVDEGFAAVKTHLGNGRDADEARVEAILDAIGDAKLMVDMNCGYERHDALRVGKMLEGYDVYWYEEPLSPYDVDGYAWLHRKLDVPIATGENEYTRWGFKDLFEAEAVDFAMPDLMRCGGITETKKICSLAGAFGVTPTPHNFSTGVGLAATLQVVACSPESEWLELDVTGYDLYEPFLASPLDIDDEGRVAVPTDPGLGVELPDDVVEEYGIE
jgi:L-alanine-DL-glutamate epimerase-like enolase superfamily enzyme